MFHQSRRRPSFFLQTVSLIPIINRGHCRKDGRAHGRGRTQRTPLSGRKSSGGSGPPRPAIPSQCASCHPSVRTASESDLPSPDDATTQSRNSCGRRDGRKGRTQRWRDSARDCLSLSHVAERGIFVWRSRASRGGAGRRRTNLGGVRFREMRQRHQDVLQFTLA